MRDLLCRLAWSILWKWWPDRIVSARRVDFVADWEGTLTEYKDLIEPAVQDRPHAFYVVEKLDHSGRVLNHPGPPF